MSSMSLQQQNERDLRLELRLLSLSGTAIIRETRMNLKLRGWGIPNTEDPQMLIISF